MERAGGGSLSRGGCGYSKRKREKEGWGKGSEKRVVGMNSMLRRKVVNHSIKHQPPPGNPPVGRSPVASNQSKLHILQKSFFHSSDLAFWIHFVWEWRESTGTIFHSVRGGGGRTFLHGHETPLSLSPPPFPILPSNPSAKQVQPRIFFHIKKPRGLSYPSILRERGVSIG